MAEQYLSKQRLHLQFAIKKKSHTTGDACDVGSWLRLSLKLCLVLSSCSLTSSSYIRDDLCVSENDVFVSACVTVEDVDSSGLVIFAEADVAEALSSCLDAILRIYSDGTVTSRALRARNAYREEGSGLTVLGLETVSLYDPGIILVLIIHVHISAYSGYRAL